MFANMCFNIIPNYCFAETFANMRLIVLLSVSLFTDLAERDVCQIVFQNYQFPEMFANMRLIV